MVRLLVDEESFHPKVLPAALRARLARGDVHEWALVPTGAGFKALGWCLESGPVDILCAPDREVEFEPVREGAIPLDLWLLLRAGMPKDKARAWLKKHPLYWTFAFDGSTKDHDKALAKSKWKAEIEEAQRARSMLDFYAKNWVPQWRAAVGDVADVNVQYELLLDCDRFNLPSTDTLIAIDFETEGQYPFMQPVGFSFSWEPGRAWYVPLAHEGGPNADWGAALRLLDDIVRRHWVAHNATFEMNCLLNLGITVFMDPEDTMGVCWHHNIPKGLKDAAAHLFGARMSKFKEVAGEFSRQFSKVPVSEAVDYGCADADYTIRIWNELAHLPGDWKRLYENVDRPLLRRLVGMERRGLRLDLPGLSAWSERLSQQEAELLADLRALTGKDINWASGPQVMDYLFKDLALEPPKWTKTGSYSTDDEALNLLKGKHPVIELIQEHREVMKFQGTYARGFLDLAASYGGDRIYPSYNCFGTKPGRLSSSGPNAQNVPPDARKYVVADEGREFFSADYGQGELRILAHVSGDRRMRETFEQGISPHMATFKEVFGYEDKNKYHDEYVLSKSLNFLIPYGGGVSAYVRTAAEGGITISRDNARATLLRHQASYPEVWQWIRQTRAQLETTQRVRTLQGRELHYPDVRHPDPGIRDKAMREGINAVIQGTLGYMVKEVMLHPRLAERLAINIHDEAVGQTEAGWAKAQAEWLSEHMIAVAQKYIDVPMTSDPGWGQKWSDLK